MYDNIPFYPFLPAGCSTAVGMCTRDALNWGIEVVPWTRPKSFLSLFQKVIPWPSLQLQISSDQNTPLHELCWVTRTLQFTPPILFTCLSMESNEKYHHEDNVTGKGRNICCFFSFLKGMCPHQCLGWWGTLSNFSINCPQPQFLYQEE